MGSEKFKVIGTGEHDFLNRWGENNVYTDFHSKVARCYFVSPIAKLLYYNLKLYTIGNRNCSPSKDTLSVELGINRKTISKYIQELEDSGLIQVVRRGSMLTNVYQLCSLRGNPSLVHSEIIHSLKPKNSRHRSVYYNVVEDYKSSNLCKEIIKSKEPIKHYRSIYNWFKKSMESYGADLIVREDSEEEVLETADIDLSTLMNSANINSKDVSFESEPNKKSKKKSSKDFSTPIDDWNATLFLNYFEHLYKNKYTTIYFSDTRKELNFLSTLIKKVDDNELVKKHMELFFENSKAFNIVKVSAFCSNHIQNMLTIYRETGNLPSFDNYNKETKVKKEDESESDYANEIEDLFGD